MTVPPLAGSLGFSIVRDAFLGARADLFDRVDITLRTRADDVASLTRNLRLGRLAHMSRLGLLFGSMRARWETTVGAVDLEMKAHIPRGARFTLSTRVVGWDADWLYVEQGFSRDGDTCAIARVQVRFSRDGRAITIPELLAEVGPWHASPGLPPSFAAMVSRRSDSADDLC